MGWQSADDNYWGVLDQDGVLLLSMASQLKLARRNNRSMQQHG